MAAGHMHQVGGGNFPGPFPGGPDPYANYGATEAYNRAFPPPHAISRGRRPPHPLGKFPSREGYSVDFNREKATMGGRIWWFVFWSYFCTPLSTFLIFVLGIINILCFMIVSNEIERIGTSVRCLTSPVLHSCCVYYIVHYTEVPEIQDVKGSNT